MKKYISALLLAAFAVSGLTALSNQKAIAECNQQEKGFISVSTSANTELVPDVVEIRLSVVTEDSKSLQKASQDNKEVSDKIYEELAALINKDKGDYVKTSNYNAYPVYSYKNNKKSIVKYEVSNNILVRTTEIQSASKMIDKALMLGATNINNINFAVSDYDKQCNDLLAIASKKAFSRAHIMANASGSIITGIKNMNGSCSTTENTPRAMYKANLMMDTAAVSGSAAQEEETFTPIKAGVIKIYANLNTSYFVK